VPLNSLATGVIGTICNTNSYRKDLRARLEKVQSVLFGCLLYVFPLIKLERSTLFWWVGEIGELVPTNNNRKMISAKRGVTYSARGVEAMEKYRARVKSRPPKISVPFLLSAALCTAHHIYRYCKLPLSGRSPNMAADKMGGKKELIIGIEIASSALNILDAQS